MLIPARGFTASQSHGTAKTTFLVSRPIPAGSIVSRVALTVRASGVVVFSFRAAVGPSSEGTEQALRGGVSVIGATDTTFNQLPAFVFTFNAAGIATFVLYPGLIVMSSPGFIVVSSTNVGASGLSVVSSFEILQEAPPARPALVPAEPGL